MALITCYFQIRIAGGGKLCDLEAILDEDAAHDKIRKCASDASRYNGARFVVGDDRLSGDHSGKRYAALAARCDTEGKDR